jgi:hypothetical protein
MLSVPSCPATMTSFQTERIYTPEEIEAMKQTFEQTLADYRTVELRN